MRRVVRPERGISMIEVVVVLAIAAVGAAAALPYLRDYGVNARLREAGNALLTEAMAAQSEAIKRNGLVQLVVNDNLVWLIDSANPGVQLRTRSLGAGLSATNATVSFGGTGAQAPLNTAVPVTLAVSMSGVECGDDIRCPALVVQVGGGMRLCANKNAC
jgi:type IV fimbrial biogenesis protein FimT